MSKPREAEVALETPEFIAWKNSGKATRESTPLHITTYEKVLMIEKSAYDDLEAKYLEMTGIAGFEHISRPQLQAKFKIAVEALEKALNRASDYSEDEVCGDVMIICEEALQKLKTATSAGAKDE